MSMTLDGITLPANEPTTVDVETGQERFLSTANKVHTYSAYGGPHKIVRVTVDGLNTTQRNNVENHYKNTANGSAVAFNVTLEGSVSYTGVHYWNKPRFREGGNGIWLVQFTFIQPSA